MAKQMKIIGNCPFCQREVGSDMRPINQLNMEHINILASELKDIQPGSTTLEKVSQHSEIRDSKTEASKEDEQSMSFLTKAMLNMVKEQFERPPDAEHQIPGDHAELVLAMLTEEQNSYERFLANESYAKHSPKRSRK
ncbi:uncharacterized protein LOC111605064 [Drosophila hydei]|uniref:Uncharacterized protein LOC111605064 n=1 Tax=Drosophila hydei TaxID=7224 RepID=A0A6J1MQ72_DROHY|nr:uncharacterized protein LOC111605064 [Drosophila hydei]